MLVMLGDDLGTTFPAGHLPGAAVGHRHAGPDVHRHPGHDGLRDDRPGFVAPYRLERITGFLHRSPTRPRLGYQLKQGTYALAPAACSASARRGPGEVRLRAPPPPTSSSPSSVRLGLVGTACVVVLYGGWPTPGCASPAGSRTRSCRLARAAATPDRAAGPGQHRRGDRHGADHRVPLPLVSAGLSSLIVTMITRSAGCRSKRDPGAAQGLPTRAPACRGAS